MKSTVIFVALILSVLVWSCNQSAKEQRAASREKEMELNSPPQPAQDEVSKESESNGVDRKFIRTADLKFKVKSVSETTTSIEDLTNREGGFVTYTNLSSSIDNVSTIKISEDSLLETTYYTVTNSITIRVPNYKLDSILKTIAKYATYLDYRTIKADDVALQLLTNRLTQKRAALAQKRLAGGGKSNGTIGSIYTEESMLDRQEEADNAKVANLSLNDQINYSTVNLLIYQRQTLKRERVANDANIEEYKPAFGSKAWAALKSGWHGLEQFILILLEIWWLLLLIGIAIFLYRRFGNRLVK